MNLLENNLSSIIVDNYDLSIGYVDVNNVNSSTLTSGIVKTVDLVLNNIDHCSEIKQWAAGILINRNSFYYTNEGIYVCLYTPDTESTIEPSGTERFNIILDDNYVWRYVTSIDKVVDQTHIIPSQQTELVKKGTVGAFDIIMNSGHTITSYANFSTTSSILSGQGLQYVIESNQSTTVISDVLVQNGGQGYKNTDLLVVTDTTQNVEDLAVVSVYVEDGKVVLDSFTNGQNYDHLDVIIFGDGEGASVSFTTMAGVLTSLDIDDPGRDYTWAFAVVVNSDHYFIAAPTIEPLNSYDADFKTHIGPNKYMITCDVNNVNSNINFYGIHRKGLDDKEVYFEHITFVEAFTPEETETLSLSVKLK